MANEFIARKGLIALDNSGISGSLDVSGSLTIESSGSTIFEVIGSEGQLFSITDSLSGSLFAVSDVSGLPILEVFSNDTVKIGSFNNEAITVSGSHTTIGGVLAIPGFTNVSASLAAAVAGGDDLGNHTATQDLNMGGNAITNVGNVDGVDVSTLKSDFDTLEGKTLISSSTQIDHDATTNFSADEHFTQANITTVGTVTSGDVSAILPSGTVSGSTQTVANLDGQNVTVSRLTVKNSVDHLKLQNSAGTFTYVNFSPQGGLEIDLGGAGNSISASQNIKTHGDFIGESTHIKLIGPDGGGGSFTYLSSSGDPAAGGFKLSLGDIDGVGNTTTLIIDDNAEQISLSKALSVTGNITVTGTVDGVDIASLENSVQANDTEIASLIAATSSYLTSVPAGTISSSAQVDHDATTNFSADEHFTQANITTVGTVTSGDISAILPSGVLSGSAQIASDISGSFTSTSSSIATDISNLERLSKGRITFLYTGSVSYAPPGYIAFLDQVTDNIIINTSSYNGVDLDASVNSDYSKFQFNEVGSLITVRKVSDGSFKTYKVATVTTNYTGNADNVGYLVDGGSFVTVMESGSISDGDEVEFIWDKSAGVGGAYGPTAGTLTKTFAGIYQPGYNYLDMFFGTATDTEYDGSPENLSGVTISSSFTAPSRYFLPAISQSESLTLGGLTVNGTITGTTITGTTTLFDTGSSTLSSNGGSLGDIVKFGGSTTIAGGLYYLNSSGGWTLAQANTGGTSTGSLAVALGTNSTTDGMLLRGFVNPFALANAGIGAPVYISSASAGRFSGLLSQQTGEIVRVVGHAYGSDLIYFNPSNNWIEL